jgi:HrpA-like RNA helicase
MFSLQVMSISLSSAFQKKGRACRTSTGTCIRLFSQKDYDEMPEGEVPELRRVPLANTVVNLIEELKYTGAIELLNNRTNKFTQLDDYIAETQLAPD